MTRVPARQGSPHIKWYLLFLALIVAVILFVFSKDKSAPTAPYQPTIDSHSTRNVAPEFPVNAIDSNQSEIEDFSFAHCESLLTDTHRSSMDWGRNNYEQWDRYLEEGHSLDEVTLAVEHFTNPNFAASFRVKQLRLTTDVNQALEQMLELLFQQAPELRGSGVRLLAQIPSAPLDDFAEKNPQERAITLQEHDVTVDDIAYFIVNSELSDDDIILMIDHASDLFTRVSFDRLETISLLDYAVAETRPRLVEALLHAGLRPTADGYLGSTMEWALSRLNYFCCEREKDAANIVLMLLPFDAVARFDVKNEHRITGEFPRNSYRFDDDDINRIRWEYGLDLTRILTRQVPSIDTDHRLIRELEAERAEYLSAGSSVQGLEADLAACEQLVEVVNKQWQPRRLHDVLNSVVDEYPDSPDRIKRELAQIDPSLVDVFRERFEGRQQRFNPVDMPQGIIDSLRQGKIEDVIEFYLAQELSDANVNWLMWNILDWDHSYYEMLKHSGLLREPLEYSDMQVYSGALRAESIQKLENAGANIRSADSRQKTLLFYAVQRADTDLVTFLEQQGYPFSFDELGQDPLHAALAPDNYRLSIEIVEELVPILMQFRPQIDEFHLSRMALIKLKYPQTYQRLVSRYAELEVPPDTELPKVR